MTDALSEDGATIQALHLQIKNARQLNQALRQRETDLETQLGQLRAEVHRLQTLRDLQSGRIEELEERLVNLGAERR